MYDESILVCDEDGDEEEYELLAGRKRAGVSPVRRAPFAQQQYRNPQQQQRQSRSFIRQTGDFARSEDDDEDSLGIMSGEDDGSPLPPPQQEDPAARKKSISSKDFVHPPQQHQQQEGGPGGKQHENLISLASNFAKKMMSSSSDKTKEKPPPDVAEVTRREQKGSHPPPPESKKTSQEQQPSSSKGHHPQQQHPQQPQQQQQKPPPPQQSRSAEEEDDEEEDEEDYDDMNMAQIEGLLNQVDRPFPSYSRAARVLPRPPPGSPPPHTQQRRPPSSRMSMDRGAAGEPYSVRQPLMVPAPPPHSSTMMHSQFHPGFGPATSNLMSFTRGGVRGGPLSEEETSPEISISEGDLDLTRMEELMNLYTGNPVADPRAIGAIPPMPTPELNNLAMVDEEVMENIMVHRKMWEYDLDMKREALRRRTLVMSDFPGVHSPGYEMYNPQDYEHLNVSPEIKELFHYITRYEPPVIGSQMDLKLKPFIPEYYPSVGDIDAFIKVIHPEVQDDSLGIKCLDEPSPFQSDPSVLDLRLRALAKQSSSKSVVVKKIDNVGKNSKVIENWIKDISDLHRSKPSPSVHYSKPMPDIDSLIQEWPPQLEDLLKNISLPASEIDCDLSTYVDIVCNLLDIPVYKSRIQSLHVLFTLYATYKHFNHYGPLGMNSANGGGGSGGGNESVRLDDGEVDRLQIS